MICARYALIEAHASLVQEEIKRMAAIARDKLAVKVGWMQRSQAQLRRYRNAGIKNSP